MSSSTDDGVALLAKITRFAQGHIVLNRAQQTEAHTLGEAFSFFLQHRMKDMVHASGSRALLYWYSNDGTPMLCRRTTVDKLESHQLIRRFG
eukprot:5285363-Lingulodinium_polyedra.AAC.1